jgi:hypothetical protein
MVTSFPNRAEDCPASLSLSRDKGVRDVPESLSFVAGEDPGSVGNSTLAPIGLSLDLLSQFLDLFGLINNIER